MDNIEPTPDSPAVSAADDVLDLAAERLSLADACKIVSSRFKGYNNIVVSMPLQIVEGAAVEFLCGHVIVAAARLRFENSVRVDKATGQILVGAYLSDLQVTRETFTITISKSAE